MRKFNRELLEYAGEGVVNLSYLFCLYVSLRICLN